MQRGGDLPDNGSLANAANLPIATDTLAVASRVLLCLPRQGSVSNRFVESIWPVRAVEANPTGEASNAPSCAAPRALGSSGTQGSQPASARFYGWLIVRVLASLSNGRLPQPGHLVCLAVNRSTFSPRFHAGDELMGWWKTCRPKACHINVTHHRLA